MEIKLIEPRGFCKGVKRALSLLDDQLDKGKSVYVLNSIVHNKFLLDRYRDKGVKFVDDIGDVPSDAILVIAPHGIDTKTYEQCAQFEYVDTTCPFVGKIHTQVKNFLSQGIPVVLIGKKGHTEALGIIGQKVDNIENPFPIFIASTVDDVELLPDFDEVGCVIQTTLSNSKYKPILDALEKKYSNVILQNTICMATTKRQNAVLDSDFSILLVVGDTSSSNASELVKIGQNKTGRAYMIETLDDIKNIEFLIDDVVAITSAASASEEIVEQVYNYLKNI